MGQPLPPGAVTLEQYIEQLSRDNPGIRISLAVEGIETFLRLELGLGPFVKLYTL